MDTQTRDLQRRYQQSGNPADEAAFFREKCRSGHLSMDALQIAAYTGYPAARLIDKETRPTKEAETDIQRWILGLQLWGKAPLVEAARSVAVTMLRIARSIEGIEDTITISQLHLLESAIALSDNWQKREQELLALSARIYDELYDGVEDGTLVGIGSAFTWLCYAGAWPYSPMENLSEEGPDGPDNCIHAAVQASIAATNADADVTLANLQRDIAAWALREARA